MRQSLTSVGACMPGSMLLFLDANVLFAAAGVPTSARHSCLIWAGVVPTASSADALEEAARNLELKRPLALDRPEQLRARLQIVAVAPPPELVAEATAAGPPKRMPRFWRRRQSPDSPRGADNQLPNSS